MIRMLLLELALTKNRRAAAAGTRYFFYIRRIDPQIRDYECVNGKNIVAHFGS